MGKIEKEKEKKLFKSPSDYNRTFLYYGFLLIICGVVEFGAFYWTEEDINEFINDNSGNSEDKFVKSILRIVVKFWGKPGYIIAISFVCIMALYEISTGIAEYRRYKKKLRLLQEGVIKNIYDIYDDYERLSLWQWIKRFFAKDRAQKKQYQSRREMKRQIKEMEKKLEK